MSYAWGLALISAAFFSVALGVVVKQRQATSCPRHSRRAGLAARAVAAVCLALGAVSVGLALAASFGRLAL